MKVIFNKNQFHPSETVYGNVVFEVEKEIKQLSLKLEVKSLEKVFFIEN